MSRRYEKRSPAAEGFVRPQPKPKGTNPSVTRTEAGIVLAWDNERGYREERRVPSSAIVTWENGAFRVSFGQRAEPVRCSPGAWA